MTESDKKKFLDAAIEAAQCTYSPYSNFPVGAAALGESGTVWTGCNIENASLGLTVCAERTAIFNGVSHGEKCFKAIACACIKGDPAKPQSLMPCGACRQVMAEFMDNEALIIIGNQETIRTFTLAELLPMAFKL